MKISMIPNKDVKTIHASQYDNSPRKWEFEPYDNNGAINVSNIKDQLVYKTENGGTEQLLPVNTSTPTTSYFDGTINYGTDTDVEFTYKQSSYTGQARIKSIKGNTLRWNQQCYGFGANQSTLSDNINSTSNIVCTSTSTATYAGFVFRDRSGNYQFLANHIYLVSVNIVSFSAGSFRNFGVEGSLNPEPLTTDKIGRFNCICRPTTTSARSFNLRTNGTALTTDTFTYNSVLIVDLTEMYGEGNEPQTADEFLQYFPLPFYSYDSGSLLNFNGTGIKTTGKNLCPMFESITYRGVTYTIQSDGTVIANGTASGDSTIAVSLVNLPSGNYYFSGSADNDGSASKWNVYIWDVEAVARAKQWDRTTNVTNNTNSTTRNQVYIDSGKEYYFQLRVMNGQTANNIVFKPMLTVDTAEFSYEPYTTSTTSLPISTYFTNGMKSAGSVYDELSDKAITRVGSVDLGTLNWQYASSYTYPYFYVQKTDASKEEKLTLTCAKYTPVQNMGTTSWRTNDHNGEICVATSTANATILIQDSNYTDATTFKSAMSGVYLNYELATYTETDIQNASLVCKNIEVPCYLSNGNLVCDATEDLTNESGFFDAKLKLKDSNGVAYSSKFKLHVEDL